VDSRTANWLQMGAIRGYSGPDGATEYCQGDYESFTDFWFSADMTPGRRIRGITDYLRRPHLWDDPQMTDNPV
jgi:hypothetical protein